MGNILIIRDSEIKLTLPEQIITTKTDGTLWAKGTPILVCPDTIIQLKI